MTILRAIISAAQRFRRARSAVIQQVIDSQIIDLIVPVELAEVCDELN